MYRIKGIDCCGHEWTITSVASREAAERIIGSYIQIEAWRRVWIECASVVDVTVVQQMNGHLVTATP